MILSQFRPQPCYCTDQSAFLQRTLRPALTSFSGRADRLRPRHSLPHHRCRCSSLSGAVSSKTPDPKRSDVCADQALPVLHLRVRDALKAVYLQCERTDLETVWTHLHQSWRFNPGYGLSNSMLSLLTLQEQEEMFSMAFVARLGSKVSRFALKDMTLQSKMDFSVKVVVQDILSLATASAAFLQVTSCQYAHSAQSVHVLNGQLAGLKQRQPCKRFLHCTYQYATKARNKPADKPGMIIGHCPYTQ